MQTTEQNKPADAQSLSMDGLERIISAAETVVREALDNQEVHPCDEHNDVVRGNKLYGPMRELYDALRSN